MTIQPGNGAPHSASALPVPRRSSARAPPASRQHLGSHPQQQGAAHRRHVGRAVVLQGPRASGAWSGIGFAAGQAIAAALDVKLTPVETSWGNAVAGSAGRPVRRDVRARCDAATRTVGRFSGAAVLLLRAGPAGARWAGGEALGRSGQARRAHRVTLGTAPDRDVTARLPHAHIERFPSNDQIDPGVPVRPCRRGKPVSSRRW